MRGLCSARLILGIILDAGYYYNIGSTGLVISRMDACNQVNMIENYHTSKIASMQLKIYQKYFWSLGTNFKKSLESQLWLFWWKPW